MACINNYYQNQLLLLHCLSSSSSPNCHLHLQNPNLSSYSNLLLLKIPKRLRLSQPINSKIRNRTFRCSSQQPIPQTGQKSTTDESDRPRFDLNLAVVLAGFAFEAYLSPPKDAGKLEVDAADCHTVFLSELFLREVYDGQLFIKLKRGLDLPQMDPWGTSDPYVVIQLDGQVAKSKVKWGTKKPVWNEDLAINVKKHPEKYLQVAVWDANLVAPHKRMGNAGISLEPICDGNLHEVLVELEGMGGGGKIQLEVQYKHFDDIDKERQWWKIPFVSQFLMNNEFASALKMAVGSENVKARQFVQSAFGQLRSFNYTYLQKGRYPNGDSSDVEGSTKSLNSLGDFSTQFLQQERTLEGSVDDSSGSTENNLVEPDTDSDVRGKESNSLVEIERTVNESMQSDEQFWKNLADVINQTVAQKLDFPVSEKIKWDGFELLKRMGSQSRRMAEAWYVESGLATPNHKDEKTKFSLPSTLNEIQSSLADIKTTLPDIKSASLDLLSKTDAILGSFMVLTAAFSQQTEEPHSVVKNESKKDASSMGDGITGYSSNETVDANPEGSVLDEREAEEMKALFSTAESAMEAWAMLATSLGRPSFIKSEFEKICFLDNISTDTQALLQVALWRDSLQKRLVVAFRGTEQVKWKDLRTDLMLAPAGLNPERIGGDFKEEVQVHSGFLSAYDSVRNRIMSLIKLSIGFVEDGGDDMPKWHIYVTGHSLGGALATLLALELSSSQMAKYGAISVTMYNFGSPRVGNKRFAELYNEKVKDSWRIVNHRDIIPTVPRLMGYCHVAQPVYLAAGDFRDALFQANMEFSGDGYEGDLIGEYTPDVLVNEFLKGEKELIEKILHAEINLFRSLRDGTGLMQHMEDFYYITLLESVRLNYRTVDNSNANESDILSA
ncbi:hypothetical protein AAC387_Pa05g0323 [Persea americana]